MNDLFGSANTPSLGGHRNNFLSFSLGYHLQTSMTP